MKLGLVGTGLLMGAGILGSLGGCATHQLASSPDTKLKLLRQKDAVILSALAPVILKGNFPTEAAAKRAAQDRFLINVDEFLQHSSEYSQAQLTKMFDLLYLAPTRILMAGLWSGWDTASEEDLEDFLDDWRDSSFNLFRLGYAQLTQLTALVYYSDPQSRTPEMYPGPPQHIPS